MENKSWLSIIGLALDIIGVLFIYHYGLPPKTIDKYIALDVSNFSEQVKNEMDRKNKRTKVLSRIGLILIILGFLFQISYYLN